MWKKLIMLKLLVIKFENENLYKYPDFLHKHFQIRYCWNYFILLHENQNKRYVLI